MLKQKIHYPHQVDLNLKLSDFQPHELSMAGYFAWFTDSFIRYQNKMIQKNYDNYEKVIQNIDISDKRRSEIEIKEVIKEFGLNGSKHIESSNKPQKSDVVILDKEFNKINLSHKCYYIKEQIETPRIIESIKKNLKNIKKGGELVIKMFGLFTIPSIQLMQILSQHFKNIVAFRPISSNVFSKNIFIICNNFDGNTQFLDKYDFEGKSWITRLDNSKNIKINDDLFEFNLKYRNLLYLKINQAITFIDKKNYRGTDYKKYKENQEKYTTKLNKLGLI